MSFMDVTMFSLKQCRLQCYGYLLFLIVLLSSLSSATARCQSNYGLIWTEEINVTDERGTVIVTVRSQADQVLVETCKQMCIEDHPECQAFVYDKISGHCTLLKSDGLNLTPLQGTNYLQWSCIPKTTFTIPRLTTPRSSWSDPPSKASSPSTPSSSSPTSSSTSSTPAPSALPSDVRAATDDDVKRTLLYVIVGSAAGGALLLTLVVLVLCCWCRSASKRRRREKPKTQANEMILSGDMNGISECSIDRTEPAPSFYYNHI